MRALISITLAVAFVGVAAASDLGPKARQGGDTIFNATVIPSLPFHDTGTTTGFTDDYSGSCYLDNGAPDVVYRYTTPAYPSCLDISLCGSQYDTGLQVFNGSHVEIACNDDFCGLQSAVHVPVNGGQTYDIVVDGYGSASGQYVISVNDFVGCHLSCPADAVVEGEPPLADNYVDEYNGGCDSPPTHPFQHVAGALPGSALPAGSAIFWGRSGWYLRDGSNYRDTDWLSVTVGPTGTIEIAFDAEYPTTISELTGTCEGGVNIVQQATGGPCSPTALTIAGAAGSEKWISVVPTTLVDTDGCFRNGYPYGIWFDGLMPEVVATEPATWSTLKVLYR